MKPTSYSDSLVEEVRDACARLLFLDAWASAIERGECPACGTRDAEEGERESDDVPGYVEGLRDALDRGAPCPECGRSIPAAGAGGEWADALADLATPPEAVLAADRIVAGLGGEEATRAALDAWDTAVRGLDPLAPFEVDSESPDRFGTVLGFSALGHGVGLSDDVRDRFRVEEVEGGATLHGPEGEVEHFADWGSALRAGRERWGYTPPKVPSVEFHAWDFDGGALLACSEGCAGVVAGEHGVERCDDCGPGLDDEGAAVRFGRLLANRGALGAAFALLDDGPKVDPLAEARDVLGRAVEVVRARDTLAAGGPAPFDDGQAFDDWAADKLAPARDVLARLRPGVVVLDRAEVAAVLDFLANVAPEDDTAWRLRERLRGSEASTPKGADLAREARAEAESMRAESDDWAYNGGSGPDPSDLDDWADLFDRLADAVLGGTPPDPEAFLAGVRGDLSALAQDVDTAAGDLDGEGPAEALARVGASLRDVARRLESKGEAEAPAFRVTWTLDLDRDEEVATPEDAARVAFDTFHAQATDPEAHPAVFEVGGQAFEVDARGARPYRAGGAA